MMKKIEFHHINDLVDMYDAFLFDLWGVIIEGDDVYPRVINVVNELKKIRKVFFVTNAPRHANRVVLNLMRWGVENISDEIVSTSGDVAINMLYNKSFLDSYNLSFDKMKIYHLGADRNDDLCRNLTDKLTNNINEANILLLSLYRDDFEDIEEFNDLIKKAAENEILILCANPDVTIVKHGIVRYCPGYFSKKVEEYGGKVVYAGKPQPEIFNNTLSKISDIEKNRILMVGDTFETDIIGAKNVGIHSAIVTTGNVGRMYNADDDIDSKINKITSYAEKVGYYPNYITSIN